MFPRKLSAFLAISGLLFVLAGCGAPGDSGSEGDESGDILVAAAMPLTGPFASDGEEMKQGLQLAIDQQNADGGLLDRKVKLVTCDIAAMEVDTVQACGERLLGENPDAIITGYDGSFGTPIFGAGDMPYLHANTFREAVDLVIENQDKYSNVFQYDPSETDYGPDAAKRLPEIADQLGFKPDNKSVAVVTADYSYNKNGAQSFIEAIEKQGYSVAVNEVTPFGGVEQYGPILSKIGKAQPAFTTFWDLDPSDAARFTNQWNQQFGGSGINSLLYLQYTPNLPEYLKLTGDSANGVLWSTVIAQNDAVGKPTGEQVKAFTDKYGHPPKGVYGFIIDDAFNIWAQAVEKAGCASCFDKVNENIREGEYSGFAGNYKFAPLSEGQYALPGDDLLPTIWSQVQNGKNVPVLPEAAAEGEIEMPSWVK